MKRIGDRALPFRLPAVADAGVTFIDPVEFLGRWVVLSFVPSLEEFDMDLWDAQGRNLQAFGAALLLVPLEARGLHSRFHSEGREHFTIVGDPLGRLQRLYGAPNAAVLGTRTNISGGSGRASAISRSS